MCVQRRKDGSMALLLYANLFFFSWCSLRWFLLIIFLLCQTKRACPWRKNLGTQLQDSQHAHKPQEEEEK